MRRIVIETELIPIEEIKNHIKTEASLLPDRLRRTGDSQELREALLRLQMQTDRVLGVMGCRQQQEPRPLPTNALPARLAKLAERLPAELAQASERRRARKLHEVKVLCQRMLMVLMLTLLLEVCPLCQIGHVLCDHDKSSAEEFSVAR
jgi:hypothetical protein